MILEPLEVKVCVNANCVLHGALDIIDQIETLNDIVDELHLTRSIEVIPVRALAGSEISDNCPVVAVGEKLINNASAESVMAIILDKTGGEEYK